MARAKEEAVLQQKALIQYNILDRKHSSRGSRGTRSNKAGVDSAATGSHTDSTTIMAAADDISEEPLIWTSPAICTEKLQTSLLRTPFANIYLPQAKNQSKRVVLDSLITEDEARYFVEEARDAYGNGLFDVDESFADDPSECSTARPDWAEHPLNDLIIDRIRTCISKHFQEQRPLYMAGAMLRRTRPPQTAPSVKATEDLAQFESGPSVCHVDKANIGYYDYSAVLYLNTQGHDFEGGQFAFNDPQRDEIIEPRRGRCVMFASGPQHLHQAKPVTGGSRMIMALWFSLTHPRYWDSAESLKSGSTLLRSRCSVSQVRFGIKRANQLS
eukprot:TRINITY_DN19053_c0_g1_i1.p1 TRINITY_DN19053_c0_g1~~TRINITY_DN19053_c0_g1_i1.p1  ORF type:complete len:336 (-),score=55.39 TRINITY_DN19053_c0_g1_i1:16-1002(-)